MTRLEMLKELRNLFADCEVLVNDQHYEDFDTDPGSAVDYRCLMTSLERMIREEEKKETQQEP